MSTPEPDMAAWLDWRAKAVAALGSFLWLGNNLHNSGTETFRELYRAALEDAETAYEAGQVLAERLPGHSGGVKV
jgi:hypothetical protein